MKPYIRNYPSQLTSYDFLKTLAVITMIIDHLGYYIFPDQPEWRAIGRMSLPIWMFLVGYANTREIPSIIWIGGFIIVAANFIAGHQLLALNILFTVAIVRYLIDLFMDVSLGNREYFSLTIMTLFLLVFPTIFLFEYGTLAILWAMAGYMLRHQEKIGWKDKYIAAFFILVTIIYVAYQSIFFQFAIENFFIMASCVATSAYFLFNFKRETYDIWTQKLPGFISQIIKFCGRRTLEIYVFHVVLFLGISFYLYPEEYSLFTFRLF
ncbi:MAG: TraX family protein [Pseudomonadota bacterium]